MQLLILLTFYIVLVNIWVLNKMKRGEETWCLGEIILSLFLTPLIFPVCVVIRLMEIEIIHGNNRN